MVPASLFSLLGHTDPNSNGILLQLSSKETTQVETVTTIASDSLGGTYFLIDSPTTAYYVWFDIADGSSDPAPAGRTGIEVDLTEGDSAATVAAALAAALNANANFGAQVSGNVVIVVSVTGGPAPDASDVDTGFTINVLAQGSSTVYYGSPNGANIRLEDAIILPSTNTKSVFVSGGGSLVVGLF
jgi:hypothetical protein